MTVRDEGVAGSNPATPTMAGPIGGPLYSATPMGCAYADRARCLIRPNKRHSETWEPINNSETKFP